MKKYKFTLTGIVAGHDNTEIVELPDEATEAEVEEEFKEWVWNQIDAFYEKVE